MSISVRARLIASSLLLLTAASCSKKSDDSPTPTPSTPVVTPYPATQVTSWLTHSNKSALFSRQRTVLNFTTPAGTNSNATITVDTAQTYQSIDGFGYTLTEGSALVMNAMTPAARTKLIKELFAKDSAGLGISYLRLSIGASDLNSQIYTYDDVPGDVGLTSFDLGQDKATVIPVLKEILAVSPDIKILGSPWTAPAWMKNNNATKGGSLLPQYYATYAQYFVKYIQQMQAQGIRIDAVTLQNEPLNPDNQPSMVMQATEQATFIKNHVGPAFATAGITTKIIAWDHNCDVPGYPISVLSDSGANPYVDGSAFHLYLGDISAMSQVHDAFPNKSLYFTEQYTNSNSKFETDLPNDVRRLVIGATRNWSRNVLQWNLAANQDNGPHTTGGCDTCLPAVTVNGSSVTRNTAYYVIAHASKFVVPGSVRIATDLPNNLPNVAFKRPDGKKVLIVVNSGSSSQNFNISYRDKVVTASLYAGSVGTYVW